MLWAKMKGQPAPGAADYRSYLLRVWPARPGAPWRAALVQVTTGERWMFAQPEALLAFLEELQPDGPSDLPWNMPRFAP